MYKPQEAEIPIQNTFIFMNTHYNISLVFPLAMAAFTGLPNKCRRIVFIGHTENDEKGRRN